MLSHTAVPGIWEISQESDYVAGDIIFHKAADQMICSFIKTIQMVGLSEKWSTRDPKNFYSITFQKLVFLVSLYPEFLGKKNRVIK